MACPRFSRTTAFGEDREGNVWIGFWDGGLARYRNGRFTLFTTADGAPAGAITSLYVDQGGRLWVSSSRGGVSRIDSPAADRPSIRFVHDQPRIIQRSCDAPSPKTNGAACISVCLPAWTASIQPAVTCGITPRRTG